MKWELQAKVRKLNPQAMDSILENVSLAYSATECQYEVKRDDSNYILDFVITPFKSRLDAEEKATILYSALGSYTNDVILYVASEYGSFHINMDYLRAHFLYSKTA